MGRGSRQERKEGAGRGSEDGRGSRRWPGDCQPEGGSEGESERTGREVEAGRSGKARSLSERNNVERAKEGDSHREGVRVFGQQPPGVWSLSNTRDIPAWGWMGYGSLDFRGYVLWGFWLLRWWWWGAWIWRAKILLLYLYNNLKQSD